MATLHNLALAAYPVGSVCMSVNAASPADIFGGTWERVQDRFLLAAGTAYAAGSTGGEAEHTLTVEEMPRHGHRYTQNYDSAESWPGTGGGYLRMMWQGINGATGTVTSGYLNGLMMTGGSQPHNNMPPYLAVYAWVRVA